MERLVFHPFELGRLARGNRVYVIMRVPHLIRAAA